MNKYKIVESMLYNYRTLKAEIINIELEIEHVKNEYAGVSGLTYSEKSSPTNAFNSIVENEVINKDKRIIQLEHIKRYKEIEIIKIDNAIESLEEVHQKIIKLRYMNTKKLNWLEIADIVGLSDVTCRKLKSESIENLTHIIINSVNIS